MNEQQTKNNKKVSTKLLCNTKKCIHDYIKDFGIIRCSKCSFKGILYLQRLPKN